MLRKCEKTNNFMKEKQLCHCFQKATDNYFTYVQPTLKALVKCFEILCSYLLWSGWVIRGSQCSFWC